MNVVGRQMQRSNHQRQYSDNFLDASFNSNWLQSNNNNFSSSSQDFGKYGGGGRVNRKSPDASRSSSLRRNGDEHVSFGELSFGLLDLHSFDTELLPEVAVSNQFERLAHARGKSFDDSDQYPSMNKLTYRSRGLMENSILKSVSVDKERSNNVAKIKVVVRKRHLNKKEIAKKEEDIITIENHSNALTVHETKIKVDLAEYVEKHEFVYNAVLDENVANEEVYSETVEPIVPLIFQRIKATCFAYGQTGSGKTYTMQPLPLKASHDILRLMHYNYWNQGFQLFTENSRFALWVCIVGLQEYKVSNVETIRELIDKGNATRTTGSTGANEESSRSHAILQLAIKRSVDGSESKPPRPVGKLSFIDLAGSERGADTTDNDKQTRMEGAEINKSLLALKECIRALDNDQGHIPFRGSKLTEVLRDSFVGDSCTVMISCISPSSGSCEHTLNTLRYADRVKSLSKGNNSKRDPLRDSTALPLSSSITSDVSFGWSKQIERDTSQPFAVNRVPSGRADGHLAPSASTDYYKSQKGDDYDYYEETYDQEKLSWKNKKTETYQTSAFDDRRTNEALLKPKNLPVTEANDFQSDEGLNVLLKEGEELASAHRKQVEETLDIVREEMYLLVDADQPGNQLDDYISKLNTILSQKAAGILQLQTQLGQFQNRLKEQNVMVSSGN